MNNLTKQSENNTTQPKSLYMYTALIFIVALIVIILSFFGQKNLDKINKMTQDNKSISAKTAELSEQNMVLVEENRTLEESCKTKDERIAALETEIVQNNELITAYNNLMTAHKFYILKDYDNVVRVFVHGPYDFCLEQAMRVNAKPENEMRKLMEKRDKYRGEYYKHYTGQNWYDARNYDLCLDSSKLGFEGCVEAIKAYMAVRGLSIEK